MQHPYSIEEIEWIIIFKNIPTMKISDENVLLANSVVQLKKIEHQSDLNSSRK